MVIVEIQKIKLVDNVVNFTSDERKIFQTDSSSDLVNQVDVINKLGNNMEVQEVEKISVFKDIRINEVAVNSFVGEVVNDHEII